MAVTLIVEDGTAKADVNTWISLADAESYIEGRISISAWTAAEDDTKNRALAQAARVLSQYVKWLGWKTDEDQGLDWPRWGICYDGDHWYNCADWWLTDQGIYAIPSDEVPDKIKDAQCELALVLVNQDTQTTTDTAGFKRISVAGTIDLEVDKTDRMKTIPAHVYQIISHLGTRKGATTRLMRT